MPVAGSSGAAARLCLRLVRCRYRQPALGAWARMGMNLLGQERLAAFRAHHDRGRSFFLLAVLVQQRPAALVDHVMSPQCTSAIMIG